jgi:hypothetical protein
MRAHGGEIATVDMRAMGPARAFLLYVAFTAGTLWPLPRHPFSHTIANPDVYGTIWLLAWAVHQGFTAPLRILEANVYYPVPNAMGLTEAFLPQALQAAPVLLLGGPPCAAFNLVLFLTFPLSALGAYLLAKDLTGSEAGAIVAGLAYGFSAFRFSELVHLQVLSTQWLPFVLLWLRRAANGGARRAAFALAAFSILMGTSSGYYAVLLAVAIIVALPWFAGRALREGSLRRIVVALFAAALAIAVALAPYALSVREEERSRGIVLSRSLEETMTGSASWSAFLNPGRFAAAPHLRLLATSFPARPPFFPFAVVLILAMIGLAGGRGRAEVRLAAAMVAAGVVLSLGPRITLGSHVVPGPFELVRILPGGGMLRAPERMGVLASLGFALLAAAGCSHLARRGYGAAARASVLLAAAEFLPADVHGLVRPALEAPPTAEWLRRAPPAPVLELPWDHDTIHYGPVYAYWSTRHWRRLVNGWGGYLPQRSFALGVIGRHFPEGWPTRELRRAGVRYVSVHLDWMTERQRRLLLSDEPLPAGLALVADFGRHRIYEIDPAGPLQKTVARRISPGSAP